MRLTQMVKTMYKVPSIQVDKNLNSVTIRDTPQVVALAEKLLRAWDKAKGEVLIEIQIMMVDRTRMKKLGVDLSSGILGIQFNPGTANEDGYFPIGGTNFGDLANYQMTVPSAVAQFLAADSDTKFVAQPKIRGLAGEKLEYIVGQKVPIINTAFQAIAAGGLNTQPVVNYTYQDIGITIKMTPEGPPGGRGDPGDRAERLRDRGGGHPGDPHHRQPGGQEHRPAQGRRNEPAGRAPPGRGAPVDGRGHGDQGHPDPREPVRRDPEDDRAERHRPDHHPPHHPGDRYHRGRRQAPLGRSRQPLRRDRRGSGRGRRGRRPGGGGPGRGPARRA